MFKELAISGSNSKLPIFSDAIPTAVRYRYVRKSDEVVEAKRPEKTRHALYLNTIAQTVLRHLYDIFYADKQETGLHPVRLTPA